MAGTDSRNDLEVSLPAGPTIILVEPQLGENIGTTARAMYNCGLLDLRIVNPRDGWPNPRAHAAASGADLVLDRARLFDSTVEAIADLQHIYATTARRRDMVKPVSSPRRSMPEIHREAARGERVGILIGPERTGLHNDDVVLAKAALEVPLNPAFSSLNLAQAVLLVAYEWRQTGLEETEIEMPQAGSRPATAEEVENLMRHLEDDLVHGGFLRPVERRPVMVRNLRNIFERSHLTEQEVRTLHGVIRTLSGRRNRKPSSETTEELEKPEESATSKD